MKKLKNLLTDSEALILFGAIIVLTIYFVGVGWGLLILPITKGFAHTLLAGAGATTLILGLASQQILSNLLSGIFIILNKSFKINDVLEIQSNKGKVIEINWHDTVIENENADIVKIPNSLISNGLYK